jgi:phosphatidylserine/phosphatidylglycerophosphate/cardiolipin synthase-like enzyme
MNHLVHAAYSRQNNLLLPQDSVIVGGTCLLEELFQMVAMQAGGELTICTPFIDEAFTGSSSAWSEMRHAHTDLRIITRARKDATNAWFALRSFPWKSAEIWQCRNLHAKIYAYTSRGCRLALVGSHNLTRQGLGLNIEAGVLFKALAVESELNNTILACQEYVNCLVRHSRIFIDTKHWPRPDELDRQEVTRE